MMDDIAAEYRRLILCDEAIFEAGNEWLASPEFPEPRPLSLASLDALRLIGIPFDLVEYDSAEIALYRWLHVYPLRGVKLALWNGTWAEHYNAPAKLSEEVVAEFRANQKRVRDMIAAVTITVRRKPKKHGAKDDTPPDVLRPTVAWHRIATVAQASNHKPEFVAWEMPIVHALSLYHDALWNDGNWTVRPGEKVDPAALDNLLPDFLAD